MNLRDEKGTESVCFFCLPACLFTGGTVGVHEWDGMRFLSEKQVTAINSSGFYWNLCCSGFELYGTLDNKGPPHGHPGPAPPPAVDAGAASTQECGPITFTYEHDFDENGLLYYLGTNGLSEPWRNPYDRVRTLGPNQRRACVTKTLPDTYQS